MQLGKPNLSARGAATGLFVCLGLLLVCLPVPAQPPVVLAVPAGEQGLARLRQWRPLADYLAERSGLVVNLEIVENHQAVLAALQDNLCDLAFVDPLWCAILVRRGLGRPLARPQIAARDMLRSVLIAHRDSIIRRPGDLAGRTVALTAPGESAAGYYVPLYLLRRSGLLEAPGARLVYSDTDLSVLKSVAYGKLEAGFVSSAVLDDPSNASLAAQVRVIVESEPMPQWTVVLRQGLRESTSESLRRQLLSAHRLEAGQAALTAAGIAAFVEARAEDYAGMLQYLGEEEEKALAASE
jgi:phosphate/phosphite/phosphonate ABC transporter binding protein